MALAYVVDSVPAELQSFYKESDGKFVLDVEGVVPSTQFQTVQAKATELESKVSEFRNNNIALKQQLEAAGKSTVDVDALLEPRITEMKTNYTTQITELQTKSQSLEAQLERVLLSDGVKEAAIKYGVLETALPDVVARARETFSVKDGNVVSKAKAKDKEGKDLTVQSWIVGLTESASHLFAQSRGAGAQRPVATHNQAPTMSAIDKISAGLSKK